MPDVSSKPGSIYGLLADDPEIFHLIERGEAAQLAALLQRDPAWVTARMKDPDQTPLMVAARLGREDLCDLLLQAHAPADAANRFGQTALSFALEAGCDVLAKRLIEAGSRVRTVEAGGATPLHIAAQYSGPAAIEALVGAGAEVEAKRYNGSTPALMASFAGKTDNVRALAAHGANILGARGPSDSCLTIASDAGHLELLNYLLDSFAWPSEVLIVALKRAAAGGYLQIAEALVAKGADPFAPSGENQKSALDRAKQRKQQAVVDYFKTLKS